MKKSRLAILLIFFLLGWMFYSQMEKEEKITEAGQLEADKSTSKKIGLEVGNTAPDFLLTTLKGDEVRLSDFRNSKVILNFWATWCPPCKAEMPHMQEFYEDQKDKDVVILAVNLTAAEKSTNVVNEFVKDYQLTFPILMDKEGEIGEIYQVTTIPTSYIINRNGIIKQRIVGPMSKDMMTKLINDIH